MPSEHRRGNAGAIIFGLLLLAAGGYYFLRNTLNISLPELEGDAVWPIILIALGAVVLLRGWWERDRPSGG